jgi:hypothetical protein
MLENLELYQDYEQSLLKYKNENLAMTDTIIQHLEKTYPEEMEELKLIIQKAKKYLTK